MTLFLLYFYMFIIGIILGSFYNVVGLRVPKRESIVFPPSHCPKCKSRLSYKDLIPIFSFIFLRGRCRNCQHKISIFYPLMELITGLLFTTILWKCGLSIELFPGLLLVSLLVIISISDIHFMVIPNKTLIVFTLLFIIFNAWHTIIPWWNSLIGAAIILIILFLIVFTSRGGIGGGDIKLFTVLGLMLGSKLVLLTLMLSSFYGSLFGIIGLISGKLKPGKPFAFGAFIALGALTSYFFGNSIIDHYIKVMFHKNILTTLPILFYNGYEH